MFCVELRWRQRSVSAISTIGHEVQLAHNKKRCDVSGVERVAPICSPSVIVFGFRARHCAAGWSRPDRFRPGCNTESEGFTSPQMKCVISQSP